MRARILVPLVLAMSGTAVGAQVASSPSYTLDGVAIGAAADGSTSANGAAMVSAEPAQSDGELVSSGFRVEVGFLRAHDPLDADAPTILDVTPEHGPISGGTPMTIQGLHFDRGGAAGVVSVTVDGSPLVNQVVVSDTTITGEAPAGTYGPKSVAVTTALGSTALDESFVLSPGLKISPHAWQTGGLIVRNYGPAGASFQTWFSPFQTSLPLPPYGTLLIGPSLMVPAIESGIYAAPDGVSEVVFPVPVNPTLPGATLHLQSVAVLSLAPLDIQFTNADAVDLN